MSKPILTIIYPKDRPRSAIREFLLSENDRLVNQFGEDYDILIFAAEIPAHLIEIHNIPDSSTDTIELLKKRIDKMLQLHQGNVVVMDIDEFKRQQKEQSFLFKIQKFFNLC